MSARSRAGLIEVLVPTLDELVIDLLHMHSSTAIDLECWTAAAALVEAWPVPLTPAPTGPVGSSNPTHQP